MARARNTSDLAEHSLYHAHDLKVILVATLEHRLKSEADIAVLASLAYGDTLLTTVKTSEVNCALVSYRQEKVAGARPNDGTFDAFTLDGCALHGILDAARALSVDAIWLDAWCYRSPTDRYDHEDFCSTLNVVMDGVQAVIWLPRSKRGSSAEYAYSGPGDSSSHAPVFVNT